MTITRKDIVAKAREYIGTPFKHQGRVKGEGVDCVGLPVCVLRDLGIPCHDWTNYRRYPDGVTLKEHLDQAAIEILLADLQPGDLIVFKLRSFLCHVGIRTDYGMIHALNEGRCMVVEHVFDGLWKSRAVRAYKFRGVE